MNLDIHISSTNLLTQKQQQEIADLTAFCRHYDGTDLSYPLEEEDLSHFLGYLPDGRLAACLTLIPYEEDLAECCAFTHPDFRRQGFFSLLMKEAISQYPDVDMLFAVSETCTDALKTLEALEAEKDSEEHMMECDLSSWHRTLQPAPADNTDSFAQTGAAAEISVSPVSSHSHLFALAQLSETEYALYHSSTLCGTASAEPVSETAVCLHHVEILPELRNQGCGTAFLHLLLPKLAGNGIQKVILQVAGDNAPAIALYKKTGFSVTKTLSYFFY